MTGQQMQRCAWGGDGLRTTPSDQLLKLFVVTQNMAVAGHSKCMPGLTGSSEGRIWVGCVPRADDTCLGLWPQNWCQPCPQGGRRWLSLYCWGWGWGLVPVIHQMVSRASRPLGRMGVSGVPICSVFV